MAYRIKALKFSISKIVKEIGRVNWFVIIIAILFPATNFIIVNQLINTILSIFAGIFVVVLVILFWAIFDILEESGKLKSEPKEKPTMHLGRGKN